jgi:hypothetical protein
LLIWVRPQELPVEAMFFHKPYREASIVAAMTSMISGAQHL